MVYIAPFGCQLSIPIYQTYKLTISVLGSSGDTTQGAPIQRLGFPKAKIPAESSLQWRSPGRHTLGCNSLGRSHAVWRNI